MFHSRPVSSGVIPEARKSAGVPVGVVQGDDAVAGAGQGAGRVQHPLEDGAEVQVLVDAETGLAQAGEALPQSLDLNHHLVRVLQLVASDGPLLGKGMAPAGPISPCPANRYKKWC